MSKSEVSIAIPDDMIKGIVMAEMSSRLGNKEELLRAVVSAAFNAKSPNHYRGETLFQIEIEKAINDAAIQAFRSWLAENAEQVKAAVLRELNKRKKHFADSLAKALLDGRFYVKPTISVEIGTMTEDR